MSTVIRIVGEQISLYYTYTRELVYNAWWFEAQINRT